MEILRAKAVLYLMCGLLLLNYGFMQLRIASIPLAEIILVLFLATANLPLLLGRFSLAVNVLPFVVWWFFGVGSALYYFNINGIWALRDATNVIESLFVLVGFSIFGVAQIRELILKKYPRFIFVLCIYGLSYPFASILQTISPQVTAGAGHSVSVLFNYVISPMMLLIGALYLVINEKSDGFLNRNKIIIAACLMLFTVGAFQARTIYIQITALLIILSLVKPSVAKQWVYILFGAVILLLLVSLTGIEFEGRLGQKVSADFFLNHFLAIFGIESDGLEGAADGVDLRFTWWVGIYEWWSQKAETMLFGLGFGFPLIDFGVSHGVMVREPHNSYISILARSGIVGFSCWVWLHICLFSAWLYSYLTCKKVSWKAGEVLLILLLAYFIFIGCLALAEDGFEKPYNAVPYYFFWGIVVRLAWFAKLGKIGKNGVIES